MKYLSIKNKVALLAAVSVVGFVAIALVSFTGNTKRNKLMLQQENSRSAFELINQIKYDLLDARRKEKDFLSRKDEKYIEEHSEVTEAIKNDIANVQPLLSNEKQIQDLTSVKLIFNAYKDQFNSVAATWQRVGLTEKSGLHGRLRQSVHEIEDRLKKYDEPYLSVKMLMMRRHEKDFLARLDPKYMKQIEERQKEFLTILHDSSISKDEQEIMSTKLASYIADFMAVAESHLSLTKRTKELSTLFADVEPLLNGLETQITQEYRDINATFQEDSERLSQILMLIVLVISLLVLIFAVLFGRAITGPVSEMVASMTELSNGNLDVAIDHQPARTELGQMAKALLLFKEISIENAANQKERNEQRKAREEERRSSRHKLADGLQETVTRDIDAMAEVVIQLTEQAERLLKSAEINRTANEGAMSASHTTRSNVQGVASACTELSASVSEISLQVTNSTRVTEQALGEAAKMNENIQALSVKAERIGEVTTLIDSIAEQTNLLALNATIEAARAGEAGKGFAVVAGEVKNLANQTVRATEDISQQIADIQEETNRSVQAISLIVSTIQNLNESSASVAIAVEQQGAATNEIAEGAENAANSTANVSEEISSVTQTIEQTHDISQTIKQSAQTLKERGDNLRLGIERFIQEIRA